MKKDFDTSTTITNAGLFDIRAGTILKLAQGVSAGSLVNSGQIGKTAGGATEIQLPTTQNGLVSLNGLALVFKNKYLQYQGSTLLGNGMITATDSFEILGGLIDLGNNGDAVVTADSGLHIGSAGTCKGIGTINGSVANDGVVEVNVFGPGLSVLAVNGAFSQSSTGTLRLILGSAALENYAQLQISGSATLAGLLEAQGSGAVPGDRFTLLTFGSVLGDFDQKTLPPLGEGIDWVYTVAPDNINIWYANV